MLSNALSHSIARQASAKHVPSSPQIFVGTQQDDEPKFYHVIRGQKQITVAESTRGILKAPPLSNVKATLHTEGLYRAKNKKSATPTMYVEVDELSIRLVSRDPFRNAANKSR